MVKEHHIYTVHAEMAAESERKGNYREAVQDWRIAARYARSGVNRNWAQSRCDFCAHYQPMSAAEPDKVAA